MAKPVQPLTAKAIREFGRSNPAFVATLPPEVQKSFAKGTRGRMPEVVRKATAKAMGRALAPEGTPKTVEVSFKNAKGRKVSKFIPESEARALARKAGASSPTSRGPLSAVALKAAGEAYAAKAGV